MGLRPRFKTPFSQARDKLIVYAMRPLMMFRPRTRFLIACSVLVLLTTLLLLNPHSSSLNENYKEGDVLTRTLVVPADITAVDLAETVRRKTAARENTHPVFNFDSSRSETSVQSFVAGWDELKQKIAPNQNINESEIERLSTIIRGAGEGHIYDDADAERLQDEIVLNDVRNPRTSFNVPVPRTSMVPLSTARRNLETRVLNLSGWTGEQKTKLASALSALIRPNVVLDQMATTTAREAAASRVPSVVISLKRGQFLAREGDTVTPEILAQIAAIKGTGQTGRPWQNFFGLLLIVAAVYWAAWKFAEHRSGASALSL